MQATIAPLELKSQILIPEQLLKSDLLSVGLVLRVITVQLEHSRQSPAQKENTNQTPVRQLVWTVLPVSTVTRWV